MKTFNRYNCSGQVRGQFTDQYGRTITIMGQFAFEYSIYIDSPFSNSSIKEGFPNGKEARKRFQQLKKKR